jgi:hypothetical protein
MQGLNPLFIIKLGAIPQPILAAVALMAELENIVDPVEMGEQSPDDCVDIEHLGLMEEDLSRFRSTTKE